MTELDDLLAVQELDTAADVLRHRREHLAERAELATAQAELATLEREAEPVQERRHQVQRAQQALEDELSALADKAASVDRQLYSGTVTNLRELQGLQQEIGAIGRRRAALEDQILERMLEAEPLDAELQALGERRATLDATAVAATGRLAEIETAIDDELVVLAAKRDTAIAAVSPALLERYEKLRSRFGGVGVAKLEGNRCLGCHLALPAAEVEAVRRVAPDEVPTCPECGRLLVR